MAAYWLGAFFYPRGLIANLKLEYYRQTLHDHTSSVNTVVVQSEITGRDKDHVSDPLLSLVACVKVTESPVKS